METKGNARLMEPIAIISLYHVNRLCCNPPLTADGKKAMDLIHQATGLLHIEGRVCLRLHEQAERASRDEVKAFPSGCKVADVHIGLYHHEVRQRLI